MMHLFSVIFLYSINFTIILPNWIFISDYDAMRKMLKISICLYLLCQFQLPAIELVVKSPPIARDQKRPPILVLIICPTRELASQAAAEANTLLKYHASIGVQVVIGGTRLALEQKRMQANPCQVSSLHCH